MTQSSVAVNKNQCTITIEESESVLLYAYALRIPAPFHEAKITRLLFTEYPMDEAVLKEETAMIMAFHAEGQRGVYVDVEDSGNAISVRLNWGDFATMWSSESLTELHFAGNVTEDHISGEITTDPPLGIYGKDIPWTITVHLDLPIQSGW